MICHARVDGPCITPGATAWGQNVQALATLKEKISRACADIRREQYRKHRLSVRIDFHLQKQRLKLSDLDNMAKVVLDSAFAGGGGQKDRMSDRRVWRLEPCKVNDTQGEFTEIWFFDEGLME